MSKLTYLIGKNPMTGEGDMKAILKPKGLPTHGDGKRRKPILPIEAEGLVGRFVPTAQFYWDPTESDDDVIGVTLSVTVEKIHRKAEPSTDSDGDGEGFDISTMSKSQKMAILASLMAEMQNG